MEDLSASLSRLPLGLILLLVQSANANLPYNPTRIFTTSSQVYILDPVSLTLPEGQLRSFKTNTDLSANSLSASTVGLLPWYAGGNPISNTEIAYTPVLDADGEIAVLAGNCSAGIGGSTLWKYATSSNKWSLHNLTDGTGSASINTLTGSNFMASAVSFSPNMTANEMDLFVFGGMCPFANSTSDTWMTAANYSNSILQIQEKGTSDQVTIVNQASQQPIAEAGFTLTPLQAQYTNSSDAVNVVQQDFLLLGGHTDGGFMNMSLIAILSLPQASWTFVSVESPNDKTELIKRDASDITPRSGHTAVLSADGSQVIVIGGWVGDTSTPASPQLAILEVGLGYGGSGSWMWSTPTAGADPFASGSGIYGHGATMLPGNVILVTGGYDIPASSSTKAKRQSASGNTQNYFFNVTSGNWITEYDAQSAAASLPGTQSPSPSSSNKTGLGVGLALGVLGLLLAGWLIWWYYRRYKKSKEQQQEHTSEKHQSEYSGVSTGPYGTEYVGSGVFRHSSGSHPAFRSSSSDSPAEMQQSASVWGRPKSREGWPWSSSSIPSGLDAVGVEAREAERSGLDVDFPSPQRGLRQPFRGRAGYHSAPRIDYDATRPSRAYGDMYAIEELSEHEGSNPSSRKTSRTFSQAHAGSPLVNQPNHLDPFRDPDGVDGHHPLGSSPQHQRPLRHMPSSINLSIHTATTASHAGTSMSAEQRRLEMAQWVQDWEAAETAMQGGSPTRSNRSVSPDKSDRTMSDLSDHSLMSHGSMHRQQSTRSVVRQYFPGLLSKSSSSASTSTRSDPQNLTIARSRPLHNTNGEGPSDPTTTTGFTHLQTESSALLGLSAPSIPRHLTRPSPPSSRPSIEPDTQPTFTRALSTLSTATAATHTTSRTHSRSRTRVTGLLGSVKRAVVPRAMSFGSLGSGGSRATSLTRAGGRPLAGVINGDGFYEYRDDVAGDGRRRVGDGRSTASSPTKRTRGMEGAVFDEDDDVDVGAEEEDASEWGESTRKAIVRRSVSEGGVPWAVKRGKSDWDRDRHHAVGNSSINPFDDPIPRPSARGLFPPSVKGLRTSVSTTGATRGTSASRSRSRSRLRTVLDAAHAKANAKANSSSNSSNNGASRPATGNTARSGVSGVSGISGRSGMSGADEDWDVEAAVEERVVQLMFTVPRAKLRVVNTDDRDSWAEATESAVAGVGVGAESGEGAGDSGGARGGGGEDGGGMVGRDTKGKGKAKALESHESILKRYDGSGWS